ncbi:PIN domain-containing protein [Hymenobacter daeguensis]
MLTILTVEPNTHFQEAYYNWQLIAADADDNKFVDVAIAAGAECIITNDRHFQVLRAIEFPSVPVVSLAEFLALFPA